MNTMKMEAHDILSCFFYLKTGKRKKNEDKKIAIIPFTQLIRVSRLVFTHKKRIKMLFKTLKN